MATATELKQAFSAGKYPTAQNFADLIDLVGGGGNGVNFYTVNDGSLRDENDNSIFTSDIKKGLGFITNIGSNNYNIIGLPSWIDLIIPAGQYALIYFTTQGDYAHGIVVAKSWDNHYSVKYSDINYETSYPLYWNIQNSNGIREEWGEQDARVPAIVENTLLTIINDTSDNKTILYGDEDDYEHSVVIPPLGATTFAYVGGERYALVGVAIRGSENSND